MSTTETNGSAGDVELAGTASLEFLEELFEQYQANPASVEPGWRQYFDGLSAGAPAAPLRAGAVGGAPANGIVGNGVHPGVKRLVTPDGIATGHAVAISNGHPQLPDAPAGEAMPLPLPPVATGTKGEERVAFLQDRVDQLVRAYRVRGHLKIGRAHV